MHFFFPLEGVINLNHKSKLPDYFQQACVYSDLQCETRKCALHCALCDELFQEQAPRDRSRVVSRIVSPEAGLLCNMLLSVS